MTSLETGYQHGVDKHTKTLEQALAVAVICQAIEDDREGDATILSFTVSPVFNFWCWLAQLDVDQTRRLLIEDLMEGGER